ncbi:hypothetical protein QTP88_013048 [Uroleucon formosanum]
MIQTFEDLRENRPKLLEEGGDLTSLKLHKRYHSLPNMSLQSISAGEAPHKTANLMAQVFSYLRENRPIPVKGNDIKSFQAHRRCKSMPNMVFKSICVCHAPEAIPSVASKEIQDLADIPAAESTKNGVMMPVSVEASSIGSLLPVSSTLPIVQPVDSDGQQLSSLPNVGIQLIGHSELKNSLAKPLEHETTGGLQDMVSKDGCREAMGKDTAITAVRPRRRTLWSRAKRFAQRMFCCVNHRISDHERDSSRSSSVFVVSTFYVFSLLFGMTKYAQLWPDTLHLPGGS